MFVSCSDDDLPPSAVDDKPWDLDKNIDESYRPGDDFFMYCNGTYWHNTDFEGGMKGFLTGEETANAMQQRIAQLDDPRLDRINADIENHGSNYEASDAAIRRLMAIVDQANTPEDLWRALAQVIREGGCTLFNIDMIPNGGIMYIFFNITDEWKDLEQLVKNWTGVGALLRRAGMSEEEVTQTVSLASSYLDDNQTRQLLMKAQPLMYLRHPELREHFSLPSMTRAATPGESIQAVMAEELGIAENMINYDGVLEMLASVEELDVPTLKAVLHSLLALDYLYASPEAVDEFNQTQAGSDPVSIESIGEMIIHTYTPYITSYAFATKYVTPEMKQQYLGFCEEMRQVFKKRIESLDWMSSATKAAALEKLDAMRINVGYPDRWIEEGLPPLDGASLVENVMQLREAYTALCVSLGGQDAQEYEFTYSIADPEYVLTIVNAFYSPWTNSLCIYPCFLLEPLYSPDHSDALNYAVFMTIGHEMTHGFDTDGANYDEIGNVRNWWTVADKMEFEDRQQLLIDCYNQLELLPEEMPGVYTPGEQTLTENIADLGGFLIAHQAYMERLDREGFYGEERLKQERKFFQGIAELWRAKYGPEYVNKSLFQDKDVHAMNKERVNGVMMNCDRWYELYDVKEGDKLYLPVERRTYLW